MEDKTYYKTGIKGGMLQEKKTENLFLYCLVQTVVLVVQDIFFNFKSI